MDPAQILPPELFSRCLQLGYDKDSFAASPVLGVCRHWRRLAIESPLYWRELSVELTTTTKKTRASIFTLGARLRNSKPEHSVSIKICVKWGQDVPEPARQVLLHVGVHMSRIKNLSMVGMPFSVMSEARSFFLEDAPRLETLELGLGHTYTRTRLHPLVPDFTLWVDMFSGNAPRLHTLTFRNMHIVAPGSGSWPLGQQIKPLSYFQNGMLLPNDQHDAIPVPLSIFPNLEVLSVTKFGSMPDPLPNLSLLRDFTAGGHVASHIAQWASLAPVARVTVNNPTSNVAKEVLGHLWRDYAGDLIEPTVPRQFSLRLDPFWSENQMRIIVTETGGRRFCQRTREFDYTPAYDVHDYDGSHDLAPLPSSPDVILGEKKLTNAVVALCLSLEHVRVFVITTLIMPRLEAVVINIP